MLMFFIVLFKLQQRILQLFDTFCLLLCNAITFSLISLKLFHKMTHSFNRGYIGAVDFIKFGFCMNCIEIFSMLSSFIFLLFNPHLFHYAFRARLRALRINFTIYFILIFLFVLQTRL